jgi:clavulanate-9-aldehyde reductase
VSKTPEGEGVERLSDGRNQLEGHSVAITGASSGIGEATARILAGAGARVALGARRVERIEALAGDIEARGGVAVALPTDVTDERQARAFIRAAHERLDGLDALVNNAGLMLLGAVEGADTREWRRMIEVNVMGLLWCTHAALPLLRERGGGHIVNVASVGGRRASPGGAVYNLTKFGVIGFSEALRQEKVEANIRVTVIEPGMVETELATHSEGTAASAQSLRAQVGEPLGADDVARSILYVLTQPAHVTIRELLLTPAGQAR